MGDGFSDPDPADPPGSDADLDVPAFDDGPPADDEDDSVAYADDMTVADGSVDCRNCAHKTVCTIFEGIAPQLVDYSQDGQQPVSGQPQQQVPADEVEGDIEPVDPHDLAVICSEYLPKDDARQQQ